MRNPPVLFVRFSTSNEPSHTRRTGRFLLDGVLDIWAVPPRHRRGPDIGKSAIACHWSHARNDAIAFHHCINGHMEKTGSKRILFSLAAQITVHEPEYENRLYALRINELKDIAAGNTRTVFDNLFLKRLGSDFLFSAQPQLVLIEGLDEARKGQDNELANQFPFTGAIYQ